MLMTGTQFVVVVTLLQGRGFALHSLLWPMAQSLPAHAAADPSAYQTYPTTRCSPRKEGEREGRKIGNPSWDFSETTMNFSVSRFHGRYPHSV